MSAIYSFFLVGPFVANVSTQVSLNHLISQVVIQYPDSAYFSGYSPGLAFSLLISLIPALTAWISSLFYMHGYVRRGAHGP